MTSGSALAQMFFETAARPIIERVLAGAGYTAGRLGSGSDVLGFDDNRSQDHDFGCRLTVLVDEEHRLLFDDLDAALDQELPDKVDGWPTRFTTSWDDRVRHKVDLHTVHDFTASRLGFDLRSTLEPAQWLCITAQSVLEVSGGPVFHDTTTAYRRIGATLAWYPADVWYYVLAAGWRRLGQELPLVGRTGELGDGFGSRVIAARLCRDVAHVAFVVERTWMPYPKWSGTGLHRLPGGRVLGEALTAALAATGWRDRQRSLVQAVELLAERHCAAGLDVPSPVIVPFFDRPFAMPNGDIHESLVERISDRGIRDLPPLGSIEQWCDNVEVLSSPIVLG